MDARGRRRKSAELKAGVGRRFTLGVKTAYSRKAPPFPCRDERGDPIAYHRASQLLPHPPSPPADDGSREAVAGQAQESLEDDVGEQSRGTTAAALAPCSPRRGACRCATAAAP